MRKKQRLFQISILLLVLIIGMMIISGRGCPKRSRDKIKAGSSNELLIAAPSNLTAIATPPFQINLSWQYNPGTLTADGFQVWRSLDGINWGTDPIATTNADTLFYFDIGVFTIGLTYYYRVRAFNNIGDRSDWSNIASATFDYSIVISAIAAGPLHSVALDSNGRVWSWGYNFLGQLGLSDWRNRSAPILITFDINNEIFENIENITAGGDDLGQAYFSGHNISRKADGTLWSWGYNSNGELGLGDTATTGAPFPVIDSDWSIIAAGGSHTIALKANRTLWTWGRNNNGQLGLGDSIDRWTPNQILTGTTNDWSMVAGGRWHTIALKTSGTLWTWGLNTNGQLGLGFTTPQAAGINTPTQILIGTPTDWSMVACGALHSIALKTGGTLWTWGKNEYGQLGLGYTTVFTTGITAPTRVGVDSAWSMVSGGLSHTIALKTGGTLWTWGYNYYGQLGLDDTTNRWTPEQVGIQTDWSRVEAGDNFSLGLKTNGTLWAWGSNNYGQLGVVDTIDKKIPTQVIFYLPDVPSDFAATPSSSFQIDLTWTDNANNEAGFRIERKIGRNGAYEEIAVIGQDVTTWSDISPTGFAPATYYYYRIRAFNDIGNSAYSEVLTAVSGDWAKVAACSDHTIGRKINGTLMVWGSNGSGQLGLGDTINRNTVTPLGMASDWAEITTGSGHTLSRKTDGTIWGWGSNRFGQLGGIGAMGKFAPFILTPSKMGTQSDWSSVSAGKEHTIALKTNGKLWVWGNNYYGELGLGNSGENTERNTPIQLGTASDWAEVAAGGNQTFGRKTSGTLWAWGCNYVPTAGGGQLGLGDTISRSTPSLIGISSDWAEVEAGFYHTLGRKTSGTLWAWGANNYGQLGLGYTSFSNTGITAPLQVGNDSDWVQVAAGIYHTLGRKTNGTLWVWGVNGYGQLGLGDYIERDTPTQLVNASDWAEVEAGFYHNHVLKTNGTLWTWGFNVYGQLGLGDSGFGTDRNVPMMVVE